MICFSGIMNDKVSITEVARRGERVEMEELPVVLTGKREPKITFNGMAVGLSENGMGVRSNDQTLGTSSVHAVLRQPFECSFRIKGLDFSEIIARILRLEPCRKDPRFIYFLAVEFLSISELDQLNLQVYIKFYPSAKKSREAVLPGPVVSPRPK